MILEEKGLRPSYQRMRILEYLGSTKSHPSVDGIFQALSGEIPSLSRTTIYTTMGLLVEAGLAVPIFIDGEELRYDADTSEHGHFRCRGCGAVYDFPLEAEGIVPALPEGFRADLVQLYCVGRCADCLRQALGSEEGHGTY